MSNTQGLINLILIFFLGLLTHSKACCIFSLVRMLEKSFKLPECYHGFSIFSNHVKTKLQPEGHYYTKPLATVYIDCSRLEKYIIHYIWGFQKGNF